MRKIIISIICFVLLFSFVSCSSNKKTTKSSNSTTPPSTTIPSTEPNTTTTESKEDNPYMNKIIELRIDNTTVEVNWLDSNSVNALKELVKDGLAINMHMYSTFEQVGSLGQSITSNDETITTSAGDICLYQSNQIVIFYGSNTYQYTKLGHINMTKSELTELLGEDDVVISLTLK